MHWIWIQSFWGSGDGEEKQRRKGRKTDSLKDYLVFLLLDPLLRQSIAKRREYISTHSITGLAASKRCGAALGRPTLSRAGGFTGSLTKPRQDGCWSSGCPLRQTMPLRFLICTQTAKGKLKMWALLNSDFNFLRLKTKKGVNSKAKWPKSKIHLGSIVAI